MDTTSKALACVIHQQRICAISLTHNQMQYQQGGYQQPMYQQQPPPPQQRPQRGGGNGCLGACLAALCCCCVAEEGCEACADCAGTLYPQALPVEAQLLTSFQTVLRAAAKITRIRMVPGIQASMVIQDRKWKCWDLIDGGLV